MRDVATLQLPVDFQRPATQELSYASSRFLVDPGLADRLNTLAREEDAALSVVLLAAFKVLLHRHSNQEDICVGYGYPAPASEALTGSPASSSMRIVALRTELNGNMPFNSLLHHVKARAQEAFEQPYIAIEKIADAVVKEQDSSRNPLFQAMFNMPEPGEEHEKHLSPPVSQGPDISFTIRETADGLCGSVDYDTALYKLPTIGRMIDHYKNLLAALADDPTEKIGALPMLTPAEKEEILVTFNNTLCPYDRDKTLVDLFEEQVAKTPGLIALRHGETTLTYDELNRRANRLANYLIRHGVKTGDNVGLIVGRSFDMIVGMYAILKAGGAYVPVDPEYPQDRQEYILRQSSVECLLADGDYAVRGMMAEGKFLRIEFEDQHLYDEGNTGIHADPTQLAYTIYTSGSTGRPKGVMIEHHMAVNLVQWVNKEFNIGTDDRLLFITSMCFDLSVYDIFGILSAGATVVIAESKEIKDVKILQDLLQRYKISFWDSVPTTLDYLVRDLELTCETYRQTALRVVFMSGDWIPVDLPARIRRFFPGTRVISLGGATEGTVWSNYFPVERTLSHWNSIPYGRPLQNNFFYILNPQLQPVPVGVTGELYIGGVGVARGYAGDREKTDYSFVKDPFNDQAGGRMYRTGDLGRMSSDMNMEFIGRKDDQVKIRGFRVELGEIESCLKQCEWVKQAVVLAKPDPDGKKRLVGYIVPNGPFNREAIVDHLHAKLPDYMVPGAWVPLDGLPLTSNGKIDKKALPEFDASQQVKDQYAGPRNAMDRIMVGIWQEALGMERLGIEDNFFELGGHSLIAVQIMTKFEKATGKNLPLAILYKYPTIRALVDSIEEEAGTDKIWKSLVPIKTTGSKIPIYIVHGDGLNVLNFSPLANYVDPEQPVYGLQAHGLDGDESPLDDMSEIARHYINEILEHNPEGPYAIGGYSFGGYVAVEMRKQLVAMGKEVKLLAMFDTNAETTIYNKEWSVNFSRKFKRQFPKLLFFTKSFFRRPVVTVQYQANYVRELGYKTGLLKRPEPTGIYVRFNKINEKHGSAFKKYTLEPFDGKIHLFRSKYRIYFVDDARYLGWSDYARKGVEVYEVPGDHKTMFQLPHAKELAESLQRALDNC